MRRHQDDNFLKIKIGIVILIVVLLLVLVIWKPFSSKDEISEQEKILSSNNDINLETENVIEDTILDNEPINSDLPTKKLGKEGLCEEYVFSDGEELKILDHEIKVEAIGSNSIKLIVDGERKILGEEENERFDSGIKVGIAKDKIFYFAAGSEHNTAQIMIGCNYDDNPNDKYVKEKGEQICEKIYNQCLIDFEIKN